MTKIRKRLSGGEGGFTLIELLVVIIIIAILAAIAIPTFLGQRQKAHDAAAKSLVRNAMTAMESAYVDRRAFDTITQAELRAIEPTITWTDTAAGGGGAVYATATGAQPATPPTALATANAVNWGGDDQVYTIGTVSASSNIFAVHSDKSGSTGTVFSKSIGGTWSSGW